MGYFLQPTAAPARPRPRPVPVHNFDETAKNEVPQFFTVESGYRFYSPELGTWLSRDPIEEEGGENLYSLLRNNAACEADRLGLASVFVTQDRGITKEITSIGDIAITKISGFAGSFDDGIKFLPANPNRTTEETINDPAGNIICGFRFELTLRVSGAEIVPNETYYYYPHLRGNDQAAHGYAPFEASRMHELGHAHAYWLYVRPFAERIHARWSGKSLSSQDMDRISQEYQSCKTILYWAESAGFANKWERDYYDVTSRAKFTRLFKSKVTPDGKSVTMKVPFKGELRDATDVWKAN